MSKAASLVLLMLVISCGGGGGGSSSDPAPAPSGPVVVAFGTSLTANGFGPLLRVHETELGITAYNRGIPGYDAEMLLDHLQAALDLHPAVLIIETAINDAYYQTPLEAVHDDLIVMIGAAEAAGATVILMTTNPSSVQRPNLLAYYQLYREVADERAVELIDLYPLWLPGDEVYIPDGIHPTAEGLEKVVYPTIAAVIEEFRRKAHETNCFGSVACNGHSGDGAAVR